MFKQLQLGNASNDEEDNNVSNVDISNEIKPNVSNTHHFGKTKYIYKRNVCRYERKFIKEKYHASGKACRNIKLMVAKNQLYFLYCTCYNCCIGCICITDSIANNFITSYIGCIPQIDCIDCMAWITHNGCISYTGCIGYIRCISQINDIGCMGCICILWL